MHFKGYRCQSCNIDFSIEPKPTEGIVCPQCGTKKVNPVEYHEDTINILELSKYKITDPKQPSNKKTRVEKIEGDKFSYGRQKYVKLTRIIQRDKNRYYEKVQDPDTGEIIREVDEPLSEHINRGSAKKNSQSAS